jgi:formate dehydrogenase iron-sulfur subunit
VRSEYPNAIARLRSALDIARARGWLGDSVLGSPLAFDIDVRVGAGAYICGEETSMLESIEGRRGVVRAKPPLPAIEGLFARPTIVNNVLTLASVPPIIAEGPDTYSSLGVDRSRGTQVFQLGGNIAHGGIVEVPFGVSLGELVDDFGGGTRSGRPVRAVQVGGPLGAYFPRASFDMPMDYEALAAADGLLGHGGIVVFDDTVDLAQQARFAMEFCAEESCGKCTPCRLGAVRGVELMDRIIAGDDLDANLELLDDLCEVMVDGSLCAMGGLTPIPIRSARRHFADDFAPPGGSVDR